jgi:hypothetical protein
MLAESNPYSTLWNKYRPVILQLMSAAAENGPQQYRLFAHEFKAVGQKEKSGFSFVLEANQGKALNNIKTSTVARNLLHVLQQSKRASELMNEATFELSMDKQFMLHVTRKGGVKEAVAEPEETSVPA